MKQPGDTRATTCRHSSLGASTKFRTQPFSRCHTHQYSSLPSSGELIRLIQLHPGDPGDDLRCSFFNQKLLNNAHGQGGYVAISYSWQVYKEKVEASYDYPLFCNNSPNFREAEIQTPRTLGSAAGHECQYSTTRIQKIIGRFDHLDRCDMLEPR